MVKSNSDKARNNIWSRITLEELAGAIASLGNRIEQLETETWRLNAKTKSSTSLWMIVINELKVDHSEATRQSLYKIWHSNRHNIVELVAEKVKLLERNNNDENDGDVHRTEESSVTEGGHITLIPDSSLPPPQRPNTRANQAQSAHHNTYQSSFISEVSFVLTGIEWKSAFNRTHQKMKPDWTDLFYKKLTSSEIRCPVKFRTPYIKKGERKQGCRFFCCYAFCTISMCDRKYQISLQDQPIHNSSALFLIRIFGEENHNTDIQISSRHLRGKSRFLVGKQANEIGPLGVFRKHINDADESLLAAGNYTECETIETLKKAAADYRTKMRIDEDIFRECRIIAHAYHKVDVKSKNVKGYVQVLGEMPFRVHLFSEQQIERYIKYCMKEKYSYVHIDATGNVLKKMREQKKTLLYGILFKDGNDPINNISLAHAIIADHTVPSISYFLGNLAYQIVEVKGKLVHPSFFIIDFCAAEMNAILHTFNGENINTHLARCWNVIYQKYNARQLRSLSFIHFCCCHVIHAVARSLSAARIDKKIRRSILYIFAFMLCSNDINQLHDVLGSVINIFGDPNEENAKENLERILLFQLNVDRESVSVLTNDKKIIKKAKKKDEELKVVDEYLRSNTAIIHQSPFNKEAILLYPSLAALINTKSKFNNVVNSMFSPSVIRIFYRWWAYLPLWTGLLWHFEERYSNDITTDVSLMYNPVRQSNAVIESYFRTLKASIYKGKAQNRPSDAIIELYRSVRAQSKANEFNVTQKSKGRKRKQNEINVEANWNKRPVGRKRQNGYTHTIDKILSKRVRSQINEEQSESAAENISELEDSIAVVSCSSGSTPSSEDDEDKISLNGSSEISKSSVSSCASETNSRVSSEYSFDYPDISGQSLVHEEQQCESSKELEMDANIISLITSALSSDNNEPITTTADPSSRTPHLQRRPEREVIIDGYTLRWPQFGIHNAIFEGRSYTLDLTCPIDSGLFALYFIYRTDINIAGEWNEAPSTSIYSTLVTTFRIAEKEGWDTARLNWLHKNNILKKFARKKSLFGSVNEQVFHLLKSEQRYSYEIKCSRLECTKRNRSYTSIELDLRTCDNHIPKFDCATVGECDVIMALPREITQAEAREKQYKDCLVQVIDEQAEDEYQEGWICNSRITLSKATFTHGYPPIIIANMKPSGRRSVEGYECHVVRLRDVKRVIRIGTVRYQLSAVVQHRSNPNHFLSTLVGRDGQLYLYDDLENVKEVRTSTDQVLFGIYSQIYEF